MSYHGGGGRGRGGRGRGRGGRGRGGSGGGGGGNYGLLTPCKDYIAGNCKRGTSCNYAHIVTLHATVQAATKPAYSYQSSSSSSGTNYRNNNNNYNNNRAQVSSIAIWEQPPPAPPKIFTGSSDGYWRLWNSATNFGQEFECNMNGKVNECLVINSNFLFCGFEAVSRAVPDVPVGMVHAWNLTQPQQPPLELQVQPAPPGAPPTTISLPYAHNTTVTALHMATAGGHGADPNAAAAAAVQMTMMIASGSRDGSIRLWKFATDKFVLAQTLLGHAREVTGLVLLPAQHLLWSAGMDNCIRIWNTQTGDCQYCITKETVGKQQQQQQQPVGHTNAITALLSFESAPGTTFILSSSLDRTVKVWNCLTGECVASETHNEGVVCMSLAKDAQGTPLLLLGMESGSIQCRSLVQTAKAQAFQLLFTLSQHGGVQHQGAVKTLASGPSATFYSGGTDGKMMVFSFSGDLGLN